MSIIKTKSEIAKIEKACQIGDKAFAYIIKKIICGITEKELSLEIQCFIRKNGAGLSFRPLVSFGKNTAEVHHKPTNRKLRRNDIIMLDFGVKIDGYCSDITRTIFMGKATEKQKRIYQTVLEAQKRAIGLLDSEFCILNSKLKAKDVDKIARDYIIKVGFSPIPHGLGHGIGQKVHEPPKISPKSKAVLKRRMVFSIEPGIYLKNFGGVRIEDLVALEKTGPRLLTKAKRGLIKI